MPAQMPMESPVPRIGGKPGGEEAAARVRIATFVHKHARTRARHERFFGSALWSARSSDERPQAGHPRTTPSHGRPGTSNRRRNAEQGCPSAPRSAASAQYGRSRQSPPLGFAAVATIRASRGHAARCVCKTAIDVVGPARERQVEEPDVTGLARRQTSGHVLWPPQGQRAPPEPCLPASAPGALPAWARAKTRVGRQGAIKGLGRAGVKCQRQIATLKVGVPRGSGRCGQGKAVPVCQHDESFRKVFQQDLKRLPGIHGSSLLAVRFE